MSTNSKKPRGLSRALYEEIRLRIADGTYPTGSTLPSTRAFAHERGLSRTTVSIVYEQLAADGLIDTRAGAVSRITEDVALIRQIGDTKAHRPHQNNYSGRLSRYGKRIEAIPFNETATTAKEKIDFVYGPLSGYDFPTLTWLKALQNVERQRNPRLGYEDPRGYIRLRKALQAHLSQSRGLTCSIDQLMIVNGSQQALDLCARLLVDQDDTVIVENPGYRMAHHVFSTYGGNLIGLDVDNHGLKVDQLKDIEHAQMIYVTPTHQFPLGGQLQIGRRQKLIEWAQQHGSWIIEDDYDSEYRYTIRPELSLYSLDKSDSVIHIGTFSKTLSPQLRLGYIVLPPQLVQIFASAKRLTDRHSATSIQLALANMLEEGTYDRHVRRIRRKQQARQSTLVQALSENFDDEIEIQGAASGLHIVVWFKGVATNAEQSLVEIANKNGVRVYPISQFYLPKGKHPMRWAGLVMGYSLLESEQIIEGVKLIKKSLQELPKKTKHSTPRVI